MKKYSRNTRNKKKQLRKFKTKGGVVKKNSDLSSWQAVYNMITSENSKLTSISYDSLVGFIFKLDVQEEYSEFLGLNDSRTLFNEPVKSLIFKIVIVHQFNNLINLEPYKDIKKKEHGKGVENKNNFIQEAVVQQNIYLKTINPNGNYICPSVIDLSLFKNDDAKQLINDLLKTKKKDSECENMLNYLNSVLEVYDAELGMLTMELVDNNYTPLYNIYKNEVYPTNCEYAIAEIIILFIKLKLVNYDCHFGNVLANRRGDSKSLLIDFGRVIDFNKPVPENTKKLYKRFTGTEFDDDFNAINQIDVTEFYDISEGNFNKYLEEIEKISMIIRFIAFIDFFTNYTKYNSNDHPFTQPQMNGLIRFLYGNGLNHENKETFNWYNLESNNRQSIISICNKIEELTQGIVSQRNTFSYEAMKKKISNKKFFDNNINVNSLYRENRPDISEGICDPNDQTCWTRTLRRVGTFLGITRKKRSSSPSPQRSSSNKRVITSKTRKNKKD